jgi:hypothetical protein
VSAEGALPGALEPTTLRVSVPSAPVDGLARLREAARLDLWAAGRLRGHDPHSGFGAPACGCTSLCPPCFNAGRRLTIRPDTAALVEVWRWTV